MVGVGQMLLDPGNTCYAIQVEESWLGMWADTTLDHSYPCESVFCRLPFFCRLTGDLSMTLSSSSKSSISRSLAMSVGSFL